MVRQERVPSIERLREWLRWGVGKTQKQHLDEFVHMTGIPIPEPAAPKGKAKPKVGPKAKAKAD